MFINTFNLSFIELLKALSIHPSVLILFIYPMIHSFKIHSYINHNPLIQSTIRNPFSKSFIKSFIRPLIQSSIQSTNSFIHSFIHSFRSCKIEEGTSGLKSAIWTPDSLHVLTRADFDIRLTVWSLTSKAVAYIKHLSKAASNGISFSR